jgi:hypothetical protein
MLIFRGPLEGTWYILSALSWLLLGALGTGIAAAGADAVALQAVGDVVLQVMDKLGNIGSFIFITGAMFLYAVFYRTRLIPRWLSGWGLVGAAIYVIVDLMKFFDFDLGLDILYAPLAVQEMVMALWLIIKGFNQAAIEELLVRQAHR